MAVQDDLSGSADGAAIEARSWFFDPLRVACPPPSGPVVAAADRPGPADRGTLTGETGRERWLPADALRLVAAQ